MKAPPCPSREWPPGRDWPEHVAGSLDDCPACIRRRAHREDRARARARTLAHRRQIAAGYADDCGCSYCRQNVSQRGDALTGPTLRAFLAILRDRVAADEQQARRDACADSAYHHPPVRANLASRAGIPERTLYRLTADPTTQADPPIRVSFELADRILTHGLDAAEEWHTNATLASWYERQ